MIDGFEALGWLGQGAFFSRFLVQWIASERAGRSVAPRVFWWLSLAGAVAVGIFTASRGESVLLFGYLVTAAIYVRNLVLRPGGGLRPWHLVVLAIGAWVVLLAVGVTKLDEDTTAAWLVVGVVGQCFWSSRFLVQWWWSERRGVSGFPLSFWWISLVGNVLLFAYAVHLGEAVWIVGLLLGPFVQARNLVLGLRERRASPA